MNAPKSILPHSFFISLHFKMKSYEETQIHKTCLLLKNSKYIEVHKIKSPCCFLQSNPLLRRFLKAYKITDICNFTDTDRTPLQYSCLENPRDRGAWWAAVHGVARSQIRLNDFTFTFQFHALERKWQPTPVFLPWESQGWGSLVGCLLWGHTELDTTEVT